MYFTLKEKYIRILIGYLDSWEATELKYKQAWLKITRQNFFLIKKSWKTNIKVL